MGSGTSSRKSSAMQTHPNQQQHLQQFQQGFQQHLQQQQQNQGQQNQGQQLQGQQFQGQQPQPTQQQYLQQQNFNGSNGEVPSNILAELKSSDNPSKQSVQNQGLQSQSGKNQGEIDPVFLMDSKVLNKLNVRQEKILFYIEKIQNAIQTDDYEAHDAIFAKYLADVFDDKIDKSDEFASKIDFKARPDVPIDSYKREQIANFKLEQLDSTAEEIEFIANHCNDMRAFADLIHRYNRTIKIVEAITVFSPKQPIGKCEQCMKRIAPLGFRVCQKCLARSVVTDQFENFIFDKKHVRALCVKRKSFLNTLDPYVCRQKCSYGFEVCDECQSEMLEALTYETVPFNFGMNAAVCKSCKVFSPPFGFENCLRCQKEALGLIKKKHVKLECGPSSKRAGLYFCKGVGNGCNPKKLLWGNNPYVEGSSICLAALHGSAVNLNGGDFTVQMLENPPTKFPGSVKNDIVSLDYVGKQSAFQVFVAVDLVDFEKFKADLYVDHARKTSLIDGSSPIKSSNFKSDYYVDHAKRTSLIEDNPPVKAPDF